MSTRKRILQLFFISSALVFLLAGVYVYKKRNWIRTNIKIVRDELVVNNSNKIHGIFYKGDTLSVDTLPDFEHLLLTVNNEKSFRVNTELLTKIPESKNILLTVEFWGNKYLRKHNNAPLDEIIDGSMDDKLLKIYESLLNNNRKIYVRINPEMDVWLNLYPWQGRVQFNDAYRHVALLWKNKNPNLKFVCGPSGFMGLDEYYPGNDVVDAISITLKSESETLFKRYPSYANLKNEVHIKLHRLRFFNQPVLLLGNEELVDNESVIKYATAEMDTINKYRAIAYNKNLWVNDEPITQKSKFLLGLYDPEQRLVSDSNINVEHIFVDFRQVQENDLKKSLKEIFSRNHDAIVTFEPWRDKDGYSDPEVLLNIISGKYDSILNQVFEDITDDSHTVYLRFAHEMEIPITRYAWQSQDPITYIRAFRYFIQLPHPFPSNVKKVWGPAGDSGSVDFYPGDDVVDYVSFAAYALPDKDITDYEKQYSFRRMFNYKTTSLQMVHKPIFITEFGVKGPEDFQSKWMEDAARVLNENPQIIGASYFNQSDNPGAWGDIEAPEWGISENTLHQFLKVLKRDDD